MPECLLRMAQLARDRLRRCAGSARRIGERAVDRMARRYAISQFGLAARTRAACFAPGTRALRFAVTGGLCGLIQLGLLMVFTSHGLHALTANTVAFLLAAQLNFGLSCAFTWRDRRPVGTVGRRWLAFHGSIASMAVVNMVVFAAGRTLVPDLAASAAGICAAAVGNFLIGDRLVFRPHTDGAPDGNRVREQLAA